jgi:D-cysteine desulfhydrase family pyridoxal phosphate-dependent enzyme
MADYFAGIPKAPLLFSPTPLHRAPRLSAELGIELWLKRDDLTGPGAFGGNKMRKLEFLIGQALAEGAEYVFTYGATQSNHAMQTAAACCRSGLKSVLYLTAIVEPDEDAPRGNILLNQIFGAQSHIVHINPGETETTAGIRAQVLARAHIARLEADGHRCYEIPGGGASPCGSLGFLSGYLELRGQTRDNDEGEFDCIYHTTGSAGTLAGLLAGRAVVGGHERIAAVSASPKDADAYRDHAVALANDTLRYLWETRAQHGDIGERPTVTGAELDIVTDYVGPGYEIPTAQSTAALLRLARTEGVTLDPVYTAKAFAGLIDHVETEKIQKGKRVLFWHTGGSASLFAEQEIVGSFA